MDRPHRIRPLADLTWANSAAAKFRAVMIVGDVEQLIFTPARARELSQVDLPSSAQAAGLVDYAIDTTKAELEALVKSLDTVPGMPGRRTRPWFHNRW